MIGSSLINESIPSCLYIVLAMAYMRYSVYFDKRSVFIKLAISFVNVLISFVSLITKLCLVYFRLYKDSIDDMSGTHPSQESSAAYKSFGITFSFKLGSDSSLAENIFKSFGPDASAFVISGFILWYAIRHY